MKRQCFAVLILLIAGPVIVWAGPEVEASNTTSLLVVYGEAWLPGGYWEQPDGSIISVFNTSTGGLVQAEVGETQPSIYEAVFFNSDSPVASVGDTLQFSLSAGGYQEGNGRHVISEAEIAAGKVRFDVTPDYTTSSPIQRPVTVLRSPYPNPFNPSVTISFDLGLSDVIDLAVHDTRGRKVATLVNGHLELGFHEYSWRGRDDRGRELPSGVYLVRLKSRQGNFVQKVSLAK